MPDMKLRPDDWIILGKLVSLPFIDTEEIAFLSDVTPHRTGDSLKRLCRLKLSASILHCTPTTQSSARYYLTRAGVRLYLERALIHRSQTTRPITREWYTRLLQRLDTVRTVYRIAKSFVPVDMDMARRTPEVIWYRRGNWTAALRFHDGNIVPIMVQGRYWGMPRFARKLSQVNKHDEGHVGGLLVVAPDYYAANKALSVLRNEKSGIPVFAVVESAIGLARSGDKIWLPLDLNKPNVSAREAFYSFQRPGRLYPVTPVVRANLPWKEIPEDLLLWSNLKAADKRYLGLIAKFHFIRVAHLQRIDGIQLSMHKDLIKTLIEARLIKRLSLEGHRRVALSDEGLRAICSRDRLSVHNALGSRSPEIETIGRFKGQFKGSEMRNALKAIYHDDSVHDFIALFAEHAKEEHLDFEFEVARHLHRGYEDIRKNRQQIAPDLQIMSFGGRYFYIEVENRAHTPKQLTDKIRPYINYFRNRQWLSDLRTEPTILFVCKDAGVANKFLILAYNISNQEKVHFPLGVTDIETVRAQSPVSKAIWHTRTTLMSGQTYPLSSRLHF